MVGIAIVGDGIGGPCTAIAVEPWFRPGSVRSNRETSARRVRYRSARFAPNA